MKNSLNFWIKILLIIPSLSFAHPINPYSNPKITSRTLFDNKNESQIQKICRNNQSLGTQAQIACTKYDWEQADNTLNRAYQQALNQTKDKQKIKLSQKNWLKKRDSECNQRYFELGGNDVTQGGGTGVPMEFMDCMITMAKQRTDNLKQGNFN